MGKGLNVPGNLEKAHTPPQKKIERNTWESSIHLLLMTLPVCPETSLCLLGSKKTYKAAPDTSNWW